MNNEFSHEKLRFDEVHSLLSANVAFRSMVHELKQLTINAIMLINAIVMGPSKRLENNELRMLHTLRDLIMKINKVAMSGWDFIHYPPMEKIELNQQVMKVMRRYKRRLINVNYADEEIFLMSSPMALQAVIHAIVRNSMDAKSPRLAIEIGAQDGSKSDSYTAVITFYDYGMGIVDATENELFNVSFSQESTTKGLGLCLAKSYALMIGGDLIYLGPSRSRGAGIFQLELPLI